MGVNGIWEHMNQYGEVVSIDTLRNKTVTIDGHIWLYEAIRGSTSHGRAPSYMVTFFKRCMVLKEAGVEMIVVFDALDTTSLTEENQPINATDCPNRALKRSRRSGGRGWSTSVYSELSSKIHQLQELLCLLGIRVVMGAEDGEAQCAQLEQASLSHGCLTQDFDYFLYGGTRLYRFDFTKAKPSVTLFSLERICQANQGADFRILNRNRLIALSMLLGNDYFERGIEKVGFIGGLEILSEFSMHEDDHPSTILDRFRSYATREIPERKNDTPTKVKLRTKFFYDAFPDGFPNSDNFLACVSLFLVPPVLHYDQRDHPLPAKPIFNRDKLFELMERCAGWDAKRVETELVRSEHRTTTSRNKAAQSKITAFFPGRKRPQKVAGYCTEVEQVKCSRREWAALTKLRKSHIEYSDLPVANQDVLLTPPVTPIPAQRKRGAAAISNNVDQQANGSKRERESNACARGTTEAAECSSSVQIIE